MSERLSVGVLPAAALLLALFAQLPAIDKAVAATTPLPLLQPICDGWVTTLAADAPLRIRLSKPLNLEDHPAPADLRIPDAMAKQVAAGSTADLPIEVPLLEVILPADPAVEIESNIAGSQPQRFHLNRAATVRLDRPVSGRFFLPAAMVVKATGGAAAAVVEGARGRLELAAGDLGRAMVTAVSGHPLIDPDEIRELAFQLVPSENGPRLRATAEAPGVAFDEAANRLSACLVSEPGGRELRIQVVDVEVDELGVAQVSLAVPRALSVRDFDQFVRGDTTYRGRAYLIGADGSYAATGPVQLHGIKLSVFIGIAATFLLLTAIAAMRRYSRDAPAAGVGPFFKGVIVGKSGDASLSLFQVALWTLITFFALVYVWWRTGNLITLTTEILGLLGFATAGSVAARWISSTRTPGEEAGTTATNDALGAALETARRLRAKADSLRQGAEEAKTAEAERRKEFQADPASKDARDKYEEAIRAAAARLAAQDMAGRLAEDAEDRLTKLRRKVRNPSLVDMLMTDGRLDLFKVQLFLFTTFTALYVAWRVIVDMAFPPIGENLLLLMGVSNGGYIAAKLAEATPLQKAQALERELEPLEKRVTTLVAEQKQLQDEEAAIRRSLAEPNLTPDAKAAFDARLATIAARLGAIEKDGKGELPDARAAADAKRKEFQEQLAAATKAAAPESRPAADQGP